MGFFRHTWCYTFEIQLLQQPNQTATLLHISTGTDLVAPFQLIPFDDSLKQLKYSLSEQHLKLTDS